MGKRSGREGLLKRVKALGFDRSTRIAFTPGVRVHCSQCEALVINGIPCHETGCPNKEKNT